MYISSLQIALVSLLSPPLKTTMLWKSNPNRTPHKLSFEWQAKHQFFDCLVCPHGRGQWQEPKAKGKEENNKNKRKWKRDARASENCKTTHCWICREFIKVHGSRSYTEGVKVSRAKRIYFMLEKTWQTLQYAHINNFNASQKFAIFSFFQPALYFTSRNDLPV